MKRILILFITAICMNIVSQAQSFTQHVQEKKGNASVTITQSKEIDELVNGADVSAREQTAKTTTNKPTAHHENSQHTTQPNTNKPHTAATPHTQHPKTEADNKAKAETHKHETPAVQKDDNDIDTTLPDTRKKVMRNSYKVNGYRVQVFAGGNSRDNKIKAQNIGNRLKVAFPDIPVYVHFYSPRWICRMGNFRTYQEANAMLTQVKKMGYKQACIVSGKITVAY